MRFIVWEAEDETHDDAIGRIVPADSAEEALRLYDETVVGSRRYDGQRLRAARVDTAVEAKIKIETSIRVVVKS
jgi:hypothetical protein